MSVQLVSSAPSVRVERSRDTHNAQAPLMAFWTYILLCADGRYYTGHTEDLERRFGEHQSGLIKGFTSSRLPVRLVWADCFQTRVEAIENELRVKKWSKAKKKALAAQDWDSLGYYAKPPKERGSLPLGVSSSLDTNGKMNAAFCWDCERPDDRC